jgi:beta-glucosidase
MPNHPVYSQLRNAVENGSVSLDKVNAAVTHILEQKFRFKIAELGQPQGLQSVSESVIGSKEHTDLAYKAALSSITLLKNDAKVLPIDRKTVKKVAVVGPWSATPRLGDQGSSNVFPKPERVVPPFQGIKARAGDEVEVVNSSNASAAAGADLVVVVAALSAQDEGEAWNGGGDRDSLEVSSDQVALIHQVAEMSDNVVVVLVGGGPITMQSWKNEVEGIVMAWYPGEKGGLALGDLLFGDINFSGHTPMTWPKRLEDEPVFGNKQEETEMGFLHGYRHFDETGVEPLFPFGYGLSYTTFEYKNLQVPCSDVTDKGMVEVKVDITNTGDVAGDTVAFMFVSAPDSNVRRAKKDLKAFTRVSLEAGQTKRVTIPLMAEDLAYWDANADKWVVEATEYEVHVGPDASSLPLSDKFLVK